MKGSRQYDRPEGSARRCWWDMAAGSCLKVLPSHCCDLYFCHRFNSQFSRERKAVGNINDQTTQRDVFGEIWQQGAASEFFQVIVAIFILATELTVSLQRKYSQLHRRRDESALRLSWDMAAHCSQSGLANTEHLSASLTGERCLWVRLREISWTSETKETCWSIAWRNDVSHSISRMVIWWSVMIHSADNPMENKSCRASQSGLDFMQGGTSFSMS